MERMKNQRWSMDTADIHTVESLFQTEEWFWLTTAVATGLAVEEMEPFCGTQQRRSTEDMIQLFNACIRSEVISEKEVQQAKHWSIENLQQIDTWNRKTMVFQEKCSMGICKGFTAYWLNFKLIELEWQQVLGSEEIAETYQFLDQVLADSEELEEIEQAWKQDAMSDDQRLFLRSHWQRSQLFWTNLYSNLRLCAMGFMKIMKRQQMA